MIISARKMPGRNNRVLAETVCYKILSIETQKKKKLAKFKKRREAQFRFRHRAGKFDVKEMSECNI